MLNFYRLFVLLFALLCFAAPSFAAADSQSASPEVVKALKKYYPGLNYEQINPTPLSGIFEIVAQGKQGSEVVYFSPATGHLIFGEIWSADRKNLTRETLSRLMAEKVDLFQLDKAIKIGNGPHKVIEVTDPDCPFCRKGSAYFAGRDDITRYVFLFPLTRLHPKAEAKARYILSAENQAEAYEEVFSGAFDNDPLPEFKDNGLLELHRDIATKVGVTGTPQYWIEGHHINGFNPQMVEKIIGK